MVEFGLKLEDNKVSEWSDHYIDYEALKKILKKAKAAVKKYEELCDKDPTEAKRITQRYRIEQKEERNNKTMRTSASAGSLTGMGTTTSSPSFSSPPSPMSATGLGETNSSSVIVKDSAISLPTLHSGREDDPNLDDNNNTAVQQQQTTQGITATERTALLENHVGEIESTVRHGNRGQQQQQYQNSRRTIRENVVNLRSTY